MNEVDNSISRGSSRCNYFMIRYFATGTKSFGFVMKAILEVL